MSTCACIHTMTQMRQQDPYMSTLQNYLNLTCTILFSNWPKDGESKGPWHNLPHLLTVPNWVGGKHRKALLRKQNELFKTLLKFAKLTLPRKQWTTWRPLYCSTIPRWNRRDMLKMCFPRLTFHLFSSKTFWERLLVVTRSGVWKRKEKVVGISKAKENVLRRFQSKVKRRFQRF